MALTWTFEFDWDGDGVLESDEFSRVKSMKVVRGRRSIVQPSGKGFEQPDPGQLILGVDNDDGRFDPLNTSSPLYPDVRQGKEMFVAVNDGSTTYDIFGGRLERVTLIGADYAKEATLNGVDGFKSLQDNPVSYPTQVDIRTDEAIAAVLDAAGYLMVGGQVWAFPTRIGESSYFGPAEWTRDLGVGTDVIPYWWLNDESADKAIKDLVDSEMGLFWFGANGQARFMGRHELYAQTPVLTLQQTDVLRDIDTGQPWEAVRNIISIKVYPKVLQAPSVLWTYREHPSIPAGETLTIKATFRYENRAVAALSLIDPVASTDYTANSLANGSGTDLTSFIAIETILKGGTAVVNIRNTGSQAAYITLLQLRGGAIDTPDPTTVEERDTDSSDLYGKKSLSLDLKWQDSAYTAIDFATWLKSWMAQPQTFPVVQIENRPAIQFACDLFDVISFEAPSLGIDADFRIGGIEHEWISPNGQGVRTTWYLEPASAFADFWAFPTEIGITSRFGF